MVSQRVTRRVTRMTGPARLTPEPEPEQQHVDACARGAGAAPHAAAMARDLCGCRCCAIFVFSVYIIYIQRHPCLLVCVLVCTSRVNTQARGVSLATIAASLLLAPRVFGLSQQPTNIRCPDTLTSVDHLSPAGMNPPCRVAQKHSPACTTSSRWISSEPARLGWLRRLLAWRWALGAQGQQNRDPGGLSSQLALLCLGQLWRRLRSRQSRPHRRSGRHELHRMT